jgi:hypothetical protein
MERHFTPINWTFSFVGSIRATKLTAKTSPTAAYTSPNFSPPIEQVLLCAEGNEKSAREAQKHIQTPNDRYAHITLCFDNMISYKIMIN